MKKFAQKIKWFCQRVLPIGQSRGHPKNTLCVILCHSWYGRPDLSFVPSIAWCGVVVGRPWCRNILIPILILDLSGFLEQKK